MSFPKEKVSVLDDGFVRVVDTMGDEAAIVQAARISYGAGTKTKQSDRDLIRYLMRHRHTTPFEMVMLKFHVRVPMDCWRQWVRHRTASVNEYSTRYSEAIDSQQKTGQNEWRLQTSANKQGSSGLVSPDKGKRLSKQETKFHRAARYLYKVRLELGVAREQARKDLPLSTYTEAYWCVNLHNLLHFLELRMDDHAQREIREYACAIGTIISKFFPVVWRAFIDYRLNATVLSKLEVDALRRIIWLSGDVPAMSKREKAEFAEKLKRLDYKPDFINHFLEGKNDGRNG